MDAIGQSQYLAQDLFLVIGLGSLGQHCVIALNQFHVKVVAIEIGLSRNWEIPTVESYLEDLVVGNGCEDRVLKMAKIHRCRAALIVTSDERVNTEAALAIRKLNPTTRIVVRSTKANLNQLLSEQLGNFIAFDPSKLTAASFALAALDTEVLAFFKLEDEWLRVITTSITPWHPWAKNHSIEDVENHYRKVINYHYQDHLADTILSNWLPDTPIRPGDHLTYIEIAEHNHDRYPTERRSKRRFKGIVGKLSIPITYQTIQRTITQFWQLSFQQQMKQVALGAGVTTLMLLIIGTVLFHVFYSQAQGLEAFYMTAILLLGGYGDLFSQFSTNPVLPWWLQLFALGLTIMGTLFLGVLYALLIEALLSSKFEIKKPMPPIPKENHVVLIGLGRTGQYIANWLQDFSQSFVAVSLNGDFDPNRLPGVPIVQGKIKQALDQVNLKTAKSVIVGTEDEILNLEVALTARNANPATRLVIRTYQRALTHNLSKLLPSAQVLSVYDVMADAFAGAAFGENILNLFPLDDQIILVTEYQIEAIDTLHDFPLGEVAYGYGIVPILHQCPNQSPRLFPPDYIELKAGDRLIVLATIDGLHRVESGSMYPRSYQLNILSAPNFESVFEGANIISRLGGCDLHEARNLMKALPCKLPITLYEQQGRQLVKKLQKVQVKSYLENLN